MQTWIPACAGMADLRGMRKFAGKAALTPLPPGAYLDTPLHPEFPMGFFCALCALCGQIPNPNFSLHCDPCVLRGENSFTVIAQEPIISTPASVPTFPKPLRACRR